jgi:cytochrome d ubiquinol oxidase subunit I
MILTANWLGLKRGDEDAMRLARRWSKAMAVTFAVGAVTGTVLSFEFGLLWPEFMARFGDAFGIAFAIRGDLLLHRGDLPRDLHLRLEALGGWAHCWSGCRW